MTAHLPPNLLALFEPREPLRYLPVPNFKVKPHAPYTGISDYVQLFTNEQEPVVNTTPPETKQQRRERIKAEKEATIKKKIQEQLKSWDPTEPKETHTTDPYHTLFVARLNYATTEETLKREFEYYGPVTKVRIVRDTTTGQSRGYAFIEFERERDMTSAYKRANEKKIDGQTILVDMERGRTITNWKPRRMGGGLKGRVARPPKSALKTAMSIDDPYHARSDSFRPSSRPSNPRPPPSNNNNKGRGDSYRPNSYSDHPRDRPKEGNRDVGPSRGDFGRDDRRDSRGGHRDSGRNAEYTRERERDNRPSDKDSRYGRDSRDSRDSSRDNRDSRETRDSRDSRESREPREPRDNTKDRERERDRDRERERDGHEREYRDRGDRERDGRRDRGGDRERVRERERDNHDRDYRDRRPHDSYRDNRY